MDDIHIDGSVASIITDRAIPPGDSGVAQSTVKLVLYALRGLGAPGTTIKVDRQVILDRTCLGSTAVKAAFRVLVGAGILTRTVRPAEGRPAQYTMSYAKLMDWLDDQDRDAVQVYSRPKQRGRVATHQGRQTPPSQGRQTTPSQPTGSSPDGTRSSADRTGSSADRTGSFNAPAYKEETALPAIPAAAERTRQLPTLPTLETRLENAAAAAVPVMDIQAWEQIAKKAGLDRDMAIRAAKTIDNLGIEECDAGQRAMERLSERLRSPKSVDNPIGLLRAIATQDGGPEDSSESLKRDRIKANKKAKVSLDLESCDFDRMRLIERATNVVAQSLGHIQQGEEIKIDGSDAVLGYLEKFNREIMLQAAKMVPMGVAS